MKPYRYRTYLLIVLMSILAFSYVDRMVFGIALDYIKTDLHFTDTQMGMLVSRCPVPLFRKMCSCLVL
jgi:sugar phosphate permease